MVPKKANVMLICTWRNIPWYFSERPSDLLCKMVLHVTLRNVNLYSLKYSLMKWRILYETLCGVHCFRYYLFVGLPLLSAFRKDKTGKDTASRPLETTTAEKRTECQLVIMSKPLTCKSTCKLQSSTFNLRSFVTVSVIKGCVTIKYVRHIQIRTML